MARWPSPLVTAGIAAVLLVLVVAVDVTVNRTYELQVEQSGDWRTVASSEARDRYAPPSASVAVDPNGTVAFRLVAHNEYPWGLSEAFQVRSHGVLLHEGTIRADARSTAVAEFEVPASDLFDAAGPEPDPRPRFAGIDVTVGSITMYSEVTITEANA